MKTFVCFISKSFSLRMVLGTAIIVGARSRIYWNDPDSLKYIESIFLAG